MWLWLAPSLHYQAHSCHLIDLTETQAGNACQWRGWTLLIGLGSVVSNSIFIKFSINELRSISKKLGLWELNGGGSGWGDIQEQTTFFKLKKKNNGISMI